jgi:hypothetical protein
LQSSFDEALKQTQEQLRQISTAYTPQEETQSLRQSLANLQAAVETVEHSQSDQSASSSGVCEQLEILKTSNQQLQSSFDEALKQTREQLKQLKVSTVGIVKEGDLSELRETVRSCEESIRQLHEAKNELDSNPVSSGVASNSSSDSDVEELKVNFQRLQSSFDEALKQTQEQLRQLDSRETIQNHSLSLTHVEDAIERLEESLEKYLTSAEFSDYKLSILSAKSRSRRGSVSMPPNPDSSPHEWSELVDDSTGSIYYYNNVTGESQWSAPAEYEPIAPHPSAPHHHHTEHSPPETLQNEFQKLKTLFESKILFFSQEMEYLKENLLFTQTSLREQIDEISSELVHCKDQLSEDQHLR